VTDLESVFLQSENNNNDISFCFVEERRRGEEEEENQQLLQKSIEVQYLFGAQEETEKQRESTVVTGNEEG
jgi:hypothetical protein